VVKRSERESSRRTDFGHPQQRSTPRPRVRSYGSHTIPHFLARIKSSGCFVGRREAGICDVFQGRHPSLTGISVDFYVWCTSFAEGLAPICRGPTEILLTMVSLVEEGRDR
jgi:hypothetical protein